MFYIMEIIMQSFIRGSSEHQDWNQPQKMLDPGTSVVFFFFFK